MSLFSVSNDVLVDLMNNWVGIECIIVLDSACCNSAIRSDYLNLLKHDSLALESPYIRKSTRNFFLKWVLERRVKLSTIMLSVATSFKTSKTLFHNINLINIRELKIGSLGLNESDKDLDFTDIINSCSRLMLLDIGYFIDENLLIKMTRLYQLEVLKIQSKTNKSSPPLILQILAEQCNKLKVVDLIFHSDDDYCIVDKDKFQVNLRDNLSNLLEQNKSINQFKLNLMDVTLMYNFSDNAETIVDSWGLIDIINQNCHNIEECVLTYSGTMNVLFVSNFLNNNDQLKSFILTNSSYRNDNDPEIFYKRKNASSKSIHCYDFEDPYSGNMYDSRDSNLGHLFSSVDNFTEIKLTNIGELCDEFIIFISHKNCSTLTNFKIEGFGSDWSLSAIRILISNCKLLEELSLIGCSHISDAEFNELCLPPNILKLLVIKQAWSLTTTTFLKLVSQCKFLMYCDFDSSPLLDDLVIDGFCKQKSF